MIRIVMPSAVMAAKKPEEFKLETAPFDPRFPNQNQTKNCFQNFVDYKRCAKAKGEDYEPCLYFKKVFKSLCPISWVEKWENQIENDIFPVPL